jgi:single-strand DNA-binding protein
MPACSVNQVTLIGHIGRDAELRHTETGTAVTTISVATSDHWTDKDSLEKKEKTEWHRVVLWGKAAEGLSPFLTKGKQVYIEGAMQTRSWEDESGTKRYVTEVRSKRINLLGKSGPGDASIQNVVDVVAPSDDDVPF